jgi:hypothetical protein
MDDFRLTVRGSENSGRWYASSHCLMRKATLFAVEFNARKRRVTGKIRAFAQPPIR